MKQLIARPLPKITIFLLFSIFLYFLYQFFFGTYSFFEIKKLESNHQELVLENEKKIKKNNNLESEIDSISNDEDALEAYAREQLGLIKKGEIIIEIKNE